MDESSKNIDEGLYSRQLYVMGHEAQHRLSTSKVLIIGLGGLGVEVAKNVVLAGAKEVVLHDPKTCEAKDTRSNFYVRAEDVNSRSVADATYSHLTHLNKYVTISVLNEPIGLENSDYDFLKDFTVVCVAKIPNYVKNGNDWLMALNQNCRERNVNFICAEICGLFCYAFSDFGDKFVTTDKDGEAVSNCLVSSILSNGPDSGTLTVTVHDEGRHNLDTGDVVTFSELNAGFTPLNGQNLEVKVTGPFTFEVEFDFGGSETPVFDNGGFVTQVKQPVEMQFRSLKDCLADPGDLMITDFAKMSRPQELHSLFKALGEYRDCHAGTDPCEAGLDLTQLEDLYEKFTKIHGKSENETVLRELVYAFGSGCVADLSPMASFLGGVVGQEVLKACSRKFSPLNQFLYFDAVECLPYWNTNSGQNDNVQEQDHWNSFLEGLKATRGSSEEFKCGEEVVFGKEFAKQLGLLKMFLVGAGAIGCEMLKTWAMMGVGCAQGGLINVTDMDQIERSNLNRQFLFRDSDLGKSKATAAANAVEKINPDVKIKAFEDRVSVETEDVFGDDFFHDLDVVCTALDNLPARLYVDSRCVYFQKPLMESGTLGTKGNTQIVVPHLTENYGATRDPPQKEFAICTVKLYPYRIEHTLQWARELFEREFENNVHTANSFISAEDCSKVKDSAQFQGLNDNVKLQSLQTVLNMVSKEKEFCSTFEDCVVWARELFEESFNRQIAQLLYNFPPGTVTSSGALFWSGEKRQPTVVNFDPTDKTHVTFIKAAANLRAFSFNIPQNHSDEEVVEIVKKIQVKEFEPKKVKIAANDSELDNDDDLMLEDLDSELNKLVEQISEKVKEKGKDEMLLSPTELEKDDDSNFHMAFITAAGNLRARNYLIEEVDQHRAKLIAGRIIPAIATTTALVSGLICLELYKLVAGKKQTEAYKCGFVNLALPLLTFSEPVEVSRVDAGKFKWSIWDRLEIDAVKEPLTLTQFINYFQEKYSVEVTMITYENLMLDSMFTAPAKRKQRTNLDMKSLVELVAQKPLPESTKTLTFVLCCSDENGEDVDFPQIHYKIK